MIILLIQLIHVTHIITSCVVREAFDAVYSRFSVSFTLTTINFGILKITRQCFNNYSNTMSQSNISLHTNDDFFLNFHYKKWFLSRRPLGNQSSKSYMQTWDFINIYGRNH